MRGRHSEKSFPCFASQGQKQGKTELFMVADLREMQENQRVSENRIDKLELLWPLLFRQLSIHVSSGQKYTQSKNSG